MDYAEEKGSYSSGKTFREGQNFRDKRRGTPLGGTLTVKGVASTLRMRRCWWRGLPGGEGGEGEDGADGELVLVLAVEGVDVESGVDEFLDPVRRGGHDVPVMGSSPGRARVI